MNTFLDTNITKTKTFVVYGNLKDTIWCPDLLPRDIEHYLVKLLKSRGYEHVIFYGEAGTKGAYCLDEKSARFFFSVNMNIPLPDAYPEDFDNIAENGENIREEANHSYDSEETTGSQVSDALDELLMNSFEEDDDEYSPGDISSVTDNQAENHAAVTRSERQSSIQKVRYAYRGQTMSEFLQKIHPLMLKRSSHMAVVFYNILTTDIKNLNLQDDILDIWEKNNKGNICLLLFPETLYNESALENRIRSFGLESKFLRANGGVNQRGSLNPINCIKICGPGIDEIKYMLHYLSIVGTSGGNKIHFKYGELDELAAYIISLSNINARRTNSGFEFMSEINKRICDYVDQEYYKNSDWDGLLTKNFIDCIYSITGQKNKKSIGDKIVASKTDWAVERVAIELPEVEQEKSLEELMEELKSLIGLQEVKQSVQAIVNLQKYNLECQNIGKHVENQGLHMVFTGNPGTGKTVIARLIGKIYRAIGVLSQGQLIEVGREDLVGQYVGHTAQKTKEVLDRALGGVLFIDEAYTLSKDSENDFGQEAIDTLLRYMENNRDDIVVIVAGYPQEMDTFIKSNPGLTSRFTQFIEFQDYSVDELLEILKKMAQESGYILSKDVIEKARDVIQQGREKGGRDFGNGRYVRNIYEAAIRSIANRVSTMQNYDPLEMITFTTEDFQLPSNYQNETNVKTKTTKQLLQELDQLIGLNQVKQQVRKLINQVKMNQKRVDRGLPITKISLHMVFTGNPGTGKTSVARIIGELYKSIGLLQSGQLIEVGREDLVGQYIGHTAQKTKEVLDRALGGVLFIDEAYTLSKDSGNDFGQEAIDTILRYMENNRDKIVVIVAGYPNEMEHFIRSNPGLTSRFKTTINFEDYSLDELMEILNLQCLKHGYHMTEGAKEKARERLLDNKTSSGYDFGNGRVVRNMFETASLNQNDRISDIEDLTNEDLMTLTEEDFE